MQLMSFGRESQIIDSKQPLNTVLGFVLVSEKAERLTFVHC
jgi:hypothetical protein